MLMKGSVEQSNSTKMSRKHSQGFIYKQLENELNGELHRHSAETEILKWQLMQFRGNRKVAMNNGIRWDTVKPLIQFLSLIH